MGIVKQILVTLLVVLVGAGLWLVLDERPSHYLLAENSPLPAPMREFVAAVLPASSSTTEGKVGVPPSGAAGTRGPAPTVVVANTVSSQITRQEMRAIASGEAERSVTVYSDVTGIIETVPFESGDKVEAGAVLANLESDNEKLAVDRARIAIAAARDKVDRVRRLQEARTVTTVEVTDAQREFENAELDLRGAEIALKKRTIVAPIAGRVGIVAVDTGDLVGNQTVIATVDDRRRLKAIFYTPEAFVPDIKLGAMIEAVSTASPGRTYRGEITAIDSRLDEASRTLRTEATLDNETDDLRPGMSFSITLELDGETYLSVDPMSVVWERTGPFVWKITPESTVAKARLRIIERSIDRVLVTSDELREGDETVVEGLQAVRDGGKVEVQNAPRPDKVASELPPRDEAQPTAAAVTPPGTAPPAKSIAR